MSDHEAHEAQRDAVKKSAGSRRGPSRHDEAMQRVLGAAYYGVLRDHDRVSEEKATTTPVRRSSSAR